MSNHEHALGEAIRDWVAPAFTVAGSYPEKFDYRVVPSKPHAPRAAVGRFPHWRLVYHGRGDWTF